MPEIGAYEAKTHLPELSKRVEQKERFLIVRHGCAVAELAPISKPAEVATCHGETIPRAYFEKLASINSRR